MFNATPQEQQPAARDMIQWVEQGKLKPLVGRTFALEEAMEAEKFLEASTLGGTGSLIGKVVIHIG
jgi:NADPH2:quinone reductase